MNVANRLANENPEWFNVSVSPATKQIIAEINTKTVFTIIISHGGTRKTLFNVNQYPITLIIP